jgi:pyridoxamine 5'-phosphate oxidase
MSSEVVHDTGNSDTSTRPSSEDSIKSWRSRIEISIAKSRKMRGSNYVQLATVDPQNNEPRCRTVVFRGFLTTLPKDHSLSKKCRCDDLSCIMKMCTDSRSQKVSEHAYQSTAELVWWFPKTSEQYRIRGQLILIGDGEGDSDDNSKILDSENDHRALMIARKELWGNLSDPARESFLDPLVPGDSYHSDGAALPPDFSIPKGGRDEEGKVVPPPSNFLLMLLDPSYVDYLNLTGEQYRQIDQKQQVTSSSNDWSQERVNP